MPWKAWLLIRSLRKRFLSAASGTPLRENGEGKRGGREGKGNDIEIECPFIKRHMGTLDHSLPPTVAGNFFLHCSGGCRCWSIATAVEKRNVHDVWPRSVQCRQSCTPEFCGPP